MALEAVGFVLFLLEGPLVDLFKAEGADEVLGVELPEHGGDAAAGDHVLASGADVLPDGYRRKIRLGKRKEKQ